MNESNNNAPDPEVLRIMRERLKPGQAWFAYQDVCLDSKSIGSWKFLCVGPDCTYTTPPKRFPDTPTGINWRYLLAGRVDLETGKIVGLSCA